MPDTPNPPPHRPRPEEPKDKGGYLEPDGTLRIIPWADNGGVLHNDGGQVLIIGTERREVAMAHSPATGSPLVTNGQLGADLIRLGAGAAFAPHTHPGDHLLIVVAGRGTITYDGRVYPTYAGEIYMVEGAVPHAVGAITDHVIMAVGAPHRGVGDPDRMLVVEYAEVLTDLGTLHCLICDKRASLPGRLHDLSCPHCPCPECLA